MKRIIAVFMMIALVVLVVSSHKVSGQQATQSGEELFKQKCAMCHPDGKNIINSEKTLDKNILESNNINTPEDIVKKMRNPGPGMTEFHETDIPNKDAHSIAEYILKTF